MNLPTDLLSALNAEITAERYSEGLYLSAGAACEAANLRGCAAWLKRAAADERAHALKFFDYIVDRGDVVVVDGTQRPPALVRRDAETAIDFTLRIFRAALEHERKITALIEQLVKLAANADDEATRIFLQWFVMEQVESEKTLLEIIARLEIGAGCASALLTLDRELGEEHA